MLRHTRRALACGLLALALAVPARAADRQPVDAALKLLPADTAFYASTLRLREQLDAAAKSKAWARIQALPAYKMARQALQAQMANDPQTKEFLKLLEQPENRELVELLADAFSHEVFCYGGANLNGFLDLLQQVNGAQQFGSLGALVQGKQNPRERLEAQGRAVLHVLNENRELLRVPDLILGFKVRDAKKAESQLARLEELVKGMEGQFPAQLRGRIGRVKVAGASYLNVTLDGSLVPWDEIPIKDYEEKEGQFDALLKKLKGMKLSVTLGVREGYLVLALGESPEGVTQIGGKGERLGGRPELKPLARFADRRLVSVSYVSKALKARTGMSAKDVRGMSEAVEELLKGAKLPEEQVKRIRKDMEAMSRDLQKNIPDPGASVAFSFLTERGQEGYDYDYTRYPNRADAQPLTLLDHVGGNPIFFAVGRSKSDPEAYKAFARWVRKVYGHVEEAVLPKLEDEQKEKYEEVTKVVFPLLRRLDEVTGTMLLPALADGQSGFVFDARWKSKHWQQAAPETEQAMPMAEVGILLGVSDEALLRKAMTAYREALNQAIAKVRESAPIPAFEIPPPQSEKVKGGTVYFYPLPPLLGLDPQVLPNAGLSPKVAALTLSKGHTERLLASRPVKFDGGPLGDPGRPLVSASRFDWPAFVDAAKPWIEYGIQAANLPPPPTAGQEGGDVLSQVRTVLEVLKVYRGSASATYLEGGTLVTHSESVVRDLK